MREGSTSMLPVSTWTPGAGADLSRVILDQVPSFGADILITSLLVITLGVPVFYFTGVIRQPFPVTVYVISALSLPGVLALAIWRVRWEAPSREAARTVVGSSVAYAMPAVIAVFSLCAVGMDQGLLGVGIMVYVAGVVLMVSSAMFGFGGKSKAMTIVRVTAIVIIPLAVLGLAQFLPHGLRVIEM
ncbi:MAG: hypothetical protein OEV43_10395, partial [Coriobacteriia bacterium]|nr:hypothetical protein [Coriobacteriia bacterium]